MGSNEKESNEYYVENTVFIAVTKHLKESESLISWAVNKFGGKKKLCILHVHQPASLVSFFGGKLSVSKFQQRAINALHDSDIQKLHKLISQYILHLSQMGVQADRMWIEMDNVDEGIVKMIAQHGIKWLVMGAAADKCYKKEMTELKSQKAIFVCEHAPVYCHIWFICRGNLVCTRKGIGIDTSKATEPSNANVTNIGRKRVYLDDIGTNVSKEFVSVEGPSGEGQALDSDVSTDDVESSPLSDAVEEVGYENDNDVSATESEYEGSDFMISEHKSPPRLSLRERGSVLRACSVDFDSQSEHHLVSSAVSFPRDMSTGKGLAVEGKRQISKSYSSLDSASFERKMEGKTRLHSTREIYSKLEQALSDTDSVNQLAFQESVQRWKAEEDAMHAKKKANEAEFKLAEEMKRRKEVQDALARQRTEHKRFREEYNKFRSEFPIIQAECSDLESEVKESETIAKELEEKIFTAVDLLISFRKKKDQLEEERDNAVQEMERLTKLKEQRVAALSGPRFPTYSLVEIGEATCSFDPSKKIGDGSYGSVYQGVLGHMEVAIRMLPNDGTQGQPVAYPEPVYRGGTFNFFKLTGKN